MRICGILLFLIGFVWLRTERRRETKQMLQSLQAALTFVRYTEQQISQCRTTRRELLSSPHYRAVLPYLLPPASQKVFTSFVQALGTDHSDGELVRCRQTASILEQQVQTYLEKDRMATGTGNVLYALLGLGVIFILW